MNVLIIGSGGREHALAWKIAQSPKLTELFIAPGNAGTSQCGTNVKIGVSDFNNIKNLVLEKHINMVVVGPEVPLVEGLHDYFLNDKELMNVAVIGPQKAGALLEGSKDFAKEFMIKHNVPTAEYKTFYPETVLDGIEFIKTLEPPYVLKADGLAAGKGVMICDTVQDAVEELKAMLTDSKFGAASSKVLIEEFLKGIELSVFVLTDGKSYKILPVAKDYKRIGEGDTGPNTGGMGSVSDVPFANESFMEKVESRIIKRTINGLTEDNIPYKGFIFFGLMNVDGDPFVIEYNARMGDPEAESVIPRIKTDLLELFEGIANNNLEECSIETDPRYSVAVMLVSKGYPGSYEKGQEIFGLENTKDCIIFHAGTITDNLTGKVKTNGGRVLAVTSFGDTLDDALKQSFKNANVIQFYGKNFRNDIGRDLLA